MATYYWVGGTGTWDTSSTNWATSSGGTGGAGVPTSADTVIFDSGSNSTDYVVTLSPKFAGTGSMATPAANLVATLTVNGVTSGTLSVGDIVQFSALQPTSGDKTIIKITAFGTGSGGTGTYTCNVLYGFINVLGTNAIKVSSNYCSDINISGPASGSVSFTDTVSLNVTTTGNVNIASTGVTTPPKFICLGTSSHTLTTNSVSMLDTFLCGTGTYTLGSDYNSTKVLHTSLGTFTTNNYNITCYNFNQYSLTTRTLNLGSSTINITSTSASGAPIINHAQVNLSGLTNCTINAGTSQINISSNTGTVDFGNKTWNNVSFTHANTLSTGAGSSFTIGNTWTSTAVSTFNNLTFTGQTYSGHVPIRICNPLTINGTLTITPGTNETTRLFIRNNVANTSNTITVNSFASGAAYVDWSDIRIAGAAGTISGTSFGDAGGCSNISFTSSKTVYWNLAGTQYWNGAGWATSSAGTPSLSNYPLAQDFIIFDNSNAAGTVTFPGGITGDIDMSARTTAMTLIMRAGAGGENCRSYGSVKFGSGITWSASNFLDMYNRSGGIKYFSSFAQNFNRIPQGVKFYNYPATGTFQLSSNVVTSSTSASVELVSGILDLNDYVLTCNNFYCDGLNLTSPPIKKINFANNSSIVVYDTWNCTNTNGTTATGTPNVTVLCNNTSAKTIKHGLIFSYIPADSWRPNFTVTGSTNPSLGIGNFIGSLDLSGFNGNVNDTAVSQFGILMAGNFTYKSNTNAKPDNFSATNPVTTCYQISTTNSNTVYVNGGNTTINANFTCTSSNVVLTGHIAITNNRSFIQSGNLTSNSYNITAGFVQLGGSGSNPGRAVLNISNSTIIATNANCIFTNTNTSFITVNSQIVMTSSLTKNFFGAAQTYNNLIIANTGTLNITGNNTFGNINNTVQPATIIFSSNTLTTISNNFNINGTSGNLITLQGSTSGKVFRLSKSSGSVDVQYVSIKDSAASGGASWNAPTSNGNIDAGNNTGWRFIFDSAVAVVTSFFNFFDY